MWCRQYHHLFMIFAVFDVLVLECRHERVYKLLFCRFMFVNSRWRSLMIHLPTAAAAAVVAVTDSWVSCVYHVFSISLRVGGWVDLVCVCACNSRWRRLMRRSGVSSGRRLCPACRMCLHWSRPLRYDLFVRNRLPTSLRCATRLSRN